MLINKSYKKDIDDGWTPDGRTFIHYGIGYRVNRALQSVCVGPVDQNGEPREAATTTPALTQDNDRAVTNLQQVELVGDDDVTAKIKVLAGQGKSTRNISKLLKDEGIGISHMTVARRLQARLAI
jgi:hypothetical protein